VRISRKTTRSSVRWLIVLLAALAAGIAATDRAILGIAMPTMSEDLRLDPATVGILLSVFAVSTAVLQIPAGVLVDKLGPRVSLAGSAALWSLATMFTGISRGFEQIFASRVLLGIGMAPQQQACAKSVSEWVPRRERGLASGVYDTGGAVGAAVAFPVAAGLIAALGWRYAFVIVGAVGVLWAAAWFFYYRSPQRHRAVSAAELEYIMSDRPQAEEDESFGKSELRGLLRHKTVWGLVVGFLCRGFTNYFFVTWYPTFLVDEYGFGLLELATVAAIPLVLGLVATLIGGWFTDELVRRGRSVTFSRKLTILIGVVSTALIAPAAFTSDVIVALVLLSAAQAGSSFSSGALWALPVDLAPHPGSVGTLGGIQNCALWIGAFVSPLAVGFILSATGTFVAPLLVAGATAVLALLAFLFMVGEIAPLPKGAEADREMR
jgi:ACS family D-galactonate transporter-like MFS transporter